MLDFAIDGLAAHRITRMIVDDVIADRPRAAVNRWLYEHGYTWAQELLRCSWCTGTWVGFGVVAARAVAPRAWRPAARALALADIAGIISSVL